VCDARKSGNSIAAVIEGFKAHRPDSGIVGVIFNGVSAARYPDMIRCAEEAGVAALGYLPFDKSVSIDSRHLGLVTAQEITDIQSKLQKLGETAETTLDIDGIIELASVAPALCAVPQFGPSSPLPASPPRIKIAVARDKAFCFMYKDTIERFQRHGGEIAYFSPLGDWRLPAGIHALYLCGGYPELYAKQLASRTAMLKDIQDAICSDVPTIAEDGGFMLLHEALDGHAMVGAIGAKAYKTERLQRFGYITMTAKSDNLLCAGGDEIRAHEFHYWDSDNPGGAFTAKKPGRDTAYDCAYATDTLYAGFPHLRFTDEMVKRFIEKAKVGLSD
jgi:cobyrinic acid a,c-diamide synthase